MFDKESQELALCFNEDIHHRHIAEQALGKTLKDILIAAQVLFEKSSDEAIFMLQGRSRSFYFNHPRHNDMKIVAEHIAGLLKSIGLNPAIVTPPDSLESTAPTVVQAKLDK